jgi:hypothetical protein
MDYIIVQAGGKGTRLEYLTENKPKALVPVKNVPMIFYLFRKYSDKRFVIIADYQKEVLREYLEVFADVKYQIVDAEGTGTASGVQQALRLIPEKRSFMLVWSDLILPKKFELPEEYEDDAIPVNDYIGISGTFSCRWSYVNGELKQKRSTEHGVAGLFLFREKAILKDLPESGELVRWFAEHDFNFKEISLAGTKEFGLLSEYQALGTEKTRPFNKITIDGDILTKEPVDEQGRKLAGRECSWYEKAKGLNISAIPKIYSTSPLRMERIHGRNIYDCHMDHEGKVQVLTKLINALHMLHESSTVEADSFSMKEAYYSKTMNRLSKIQDLVPFGREPYITVNGRKCRNVYYHKRKLEKALERITCNQFAFIHGDCTFSNLMIRDNGDPVLIDPRGYFGFTELYGDVRYDWAKLYYSIVGNYDRFNLKDFSLIIGGNEGHMSEGKQLNYGEVNLEITSNGWEDCEDDFFSLTGADSWEIKLLHAVIWLSLTTYAWQDYDSVCGAFYNGLWYLEEAL